MRNEHIIEIIDSKPLTQFSEAELGEIRAHTNDCGECRRAFEAAQVSHFLVTERAAEAYEPPPFFHTRVLAAIREREVESWSLRKMWRAAGALASSMAATVAALAFLTFVVPGNEVVSETSPPGSGYYSAEEIIFNQADLAEEQESDGQVLTTLYETEEAER